MDLINLVWFAAGAAVAAVVTHLLARNRQARIEERNRSLFEQHEAVELRLQEETSRANESEKRVVELQSDQRNLRERLAEQKKEFESMQEELRLKFENLANSILEEKTKKFTEQNREKLDQLLTPLSEKIEEFRKRVEEGQREDLKGRSALEQHLKTLQTLNQNMSEEAKNLTRALKGDTRRQGEWGEVILQRILERSGLQEGREYELQQSFTAEDGSRPRPDVVIRLPGEKHLVVDSKVSLKAYEEQVSAETGRQQEQALKRHVASIREHVRRLGKKNYQNLHGGRSPDFILLFIPVEPAFGLAIQHDPELYNDAFDRNIILVSPTTLLATLATIDNVWKQEYQNRHAMEIAARGGALYDKFVLFAESMESIGQRIDQTRQSYDEAMGRLSIGSGNLVRQVEMLRKLGAKASKQLPQSLAAYVEDEEELPSEDGEELTKRPEEGTPDET